MGLVSLPTMLRRGYDKRLISGTICASGTLGQIIPPSVILILLGDIMGVSVGDLYIGAVLPGPRPGRPLHHLHRHPRPAGPDLAPAIPGEELRAFRGEAIRRVTIALIPAFVLIVAVLGSIFAGVASPTEAASVGAVGGIVLTMVKGRFSWAMLRNVMQATTRITSLAFIILVGANCFGLVFRGLNGDHLIQDFLKSLPFGPYGVLAVVMFVIFLLGFFIDFFEICFIHVPILMPVLVQHFGFDPLWLGVVIGVNLQTSFLTPPFGFALFYLRGVAPARDQDDGHLPGRGALRGPAAHRPDARRSPSPSSSAPSSPSSAASGGLAERKGRSPPAPPASSGGPSGPYTPATCVVGGFRDQAPVVAVLRTC